MRPRARTGTRPAHAVRVRVGGLWLPRPHLPRRNDVDGCARARGGWGGGLAVQSRAEGEGSPVYGTDEGEGIFLPAPLC